MHASVGLLGRGANKILMTVRAIHAKMAQLVVTVTIGIIALARKDLQVRTCETKSNFYDFWLTKLHSDHTEEIFYTSLFQEKIVTRMWTTAWEILVIMVYASVCSFKKLIVCTYIPRTHYHVYLFGWWRFNRTIILLFFNKRWDQHIPLPM